MLGERAAALREVGEAWKQRGWVGGAEGAEWLLTQSRASCLTFVDLLCELVPSYRDHRDHASEPLVFAKRAQLCASMVHKLFGANFNDMDQLTVFSDYRLPQLMRQYGVMTLSPALTEQVEGHALVPAHSDQEIAIRAATVVAAEHVRRALADRTGRPLTAAAVDYMLWRTTVDLDAFGAITMAFHRTRTTSY